MFWIVLFMFLNHLSIPHTPNPLFHPVSFFPTQMQSLISFKSYTASYITNLDNSIHPFPLLFLLLFLRTLLTFLHPECCATPFILLFQQRNAQSHTSFFNSSHISILSVLPQCDSAINVLSIHPSLIALLFNPLS